MPLSIFQLSYSITDAENEYKTIFVVLVKIGAEGQSS